MNTLQKYETLTRGDVIVFRCACACGWSYQHLNPDDVNREGAHHHELHRWEAARRRHPSMGAHLAVVQ